MTKVQSVKPVSSVSKPETHSSHTTLKITLLVLGVLLGGGAVACHFMGWGLIPLICLSGTGALCLITTVALQCFGKSSKTQHSSGPRVHQKPTEISSPTLSVSSQVGDDDVDHLAPLPPPMISRAQPSQTASSIVPPERQERDEDLHRLKARAEPAQPVSSSVLSSEKPKLPEKPASVPAPPPKPAPVLPAAAISFLQRLESEKPKDPESFFKRYIEVGCDAKEFLQLLRENPHFIKKPVTKEIGSVLHFLFKWTQGPISMPGFLEFFRKCLDQSPSLASLQDGEGQTLLHCIAGNARICDHYGDKKKTEQLRYDMVHLLIQKRADPNLQDTITMLGPPQHAPKEETHREMLKRITIKTESKDQMLQRLKKPNETLDQMYRRMANESELPQAIAVYLQRKPPAELAAMRRANETGPELCKRIGMEKMFFRLQRTETSEERYLRLRLPPETEEAFYKRLALPLESVGDMYARLTRDETRDEVYLRLRLPPETREAMFKRLALSQDETELMIFARLSNRDETQDEFYNRLRVCETEAAMYKRLAQPRKTTTMYMLAKPDATTAMDKPLTPPFETEQELMMRLKRPVNEKPHEVYLRLRLCETEDEMFDRLRRENEEARLERLLDRQPIVRPHEAALHKAVKIPNNLQTIWLLLQNRSNLLCRNFDELNPLQLALCSAHTLNLPGRKVLNDHEKELLNLFERVLTGGGKAAVLTNFPATFNTSVKPAERSVDNPHRNPQETPLTSLAFVKTYNFSEVFRTQFFGLVVPHIRGRAPTGPQAEAAQIGRLVAHLLGRH